MNCLLKRRFARLFDSLLEFVKSVEPPAKTSPFTFLSPIDKKFNDEPEGDGVSARLNNPLTNICTIKTIGDGAMHGSLANQSQIDNTLTLQID